MINLIYNSDIKEIYIRNHANLAWRETNINPPDLGFEFDFIFYEETQNIKYIKGVRTPLTDEEKNLIEVFVNSLTPPSFAAKINVIEGMTDREIKIDKMLGILHYNVYRNLEGLAKSLRYENMSDVMICGRQGSNDRFAEEARRLLAYSDLMWNKFYDIRDQINAFTENNNPVPDLEFFALQMPPAPDITYFKGG